VVARSTRAHIDPSEEISLRHPDHFPGKSDKFPLVPERLGFALPGLITKLMDDRFFGSIEVHIRILFSNAYYHAFSGYEYILTYHIDALVFSDQFEM
jgi:hypothetical protein